MGDSRDDPPDGRCDELSRLLAEAERVLGDQRRALVRLDGPAIEAAAGTQAVLEARLRALTAAGTPVGATERRAIERMRTAALGTLVLVAHARACVRGAMDLATGQTSPTYAPGRPAPATAAVRVDTRG